MATSGTALESLYQRYRDRAEFFTIYQAEHHPGRQWGEFNRHTDQADRGRASLRCPHMRGVTIPALLDDEAGTAEFLYRTHPFRTVIIDVQGSIALDFDSGKAFGGPVAATLDALLANFGQLAPELAARDRCDAVGKPAFPCWLPRADYFGETPATWPDAVQKLYRTDIPAGETDTTYDASGNEVAVAKSLAAEMTRLRGKIVRLFWGGNGVEATPPERPVVLVFTGSDPEIVRKSAAGLTALAQRVHGNADGYLIDSAPASSILARAEQAQRLARELPAFPCLLDDPENSIAYAYQATTARIVVVSPAQEGRVVRYLSAPTPEGFAHGLTECLPFLRSTGK